jgi:hypothetical protein
MPAPALRGGHGQSGSGHGRRYEHSYLCAPRLGVSVKTWPLHLGISRHGTNKASALSRRVLSLAWASRSSHPTSKPHVIFSRREGCQPFASDVPDSRRAALFDLPGLKVKEFTFMPGAGAVIFASVLKYRVFLMALGIRRDVAAHDNFRKNGGKPFEAGPSPMKSV